MSLRIRILTIDHYLARPIAEFDHTKNQLNDKPLKRVPVLRIFGNDPNGVIACVHIHKVR